MTVTGRLYSSLRMGWGVATLFLATGVLTVAAGCGGSSGNGGGGTPSATPTIMSVSITCPSAVVQTGQTSQCAASVTGTGSYDSSLSWSVNGTTSGSGTVGTISTAGLYTAPSSVPTPYTVSVTATSVADTTKSASFSILVAGTISTVTQPISSASGEQSLFRTAAASRLRLGCFLPTKPLLSPRYRTFPSNPRMFRSRGSGQA